MKRNDGPSWNRLSLISFLDALGEDDHGDEPLPASLVTWALRAAPSFSEHCADALRARAHSPAKVASGASMHGGLIAAHVILIPLVMHFQHSKSVGRTAAYRVLTEWLGARNQMVGVNERSLQRIWDKYQSVAHLWAAFVLSDEKLSTTADELVVFLSLAEGIRCWGESNIVRRIPASRFLMAGLPGQSPPTFRSLASSTILITS